MRFSVVDNQDQIARAFDAITRNWRNGIGMEEFKRDIDWSGRNQHPTLRNKRDFEIWWRPKEAIWGYFGRDFYSEPQKRWQHMFFAGLSLDKDPLRIESQFVFPVDEASPRFGGLFIQDDKNTYLAHTGRVYGPAGFLDYCKQKVIKEYTDRAVCLVNIAPQNFGVRLCIANVNSPELPQRVQEFTRLRLEWMG